MPAHNAPCCVIFAGPYPSVTIGAARDRSSDIHRKLSTKRRDGYVRAYTTDTKLLRNVCYKFNSARSIRLNVLRLRSELTVWACEQKVVRNKVVQGAYICAKLCGSNPRFEDDNFLICNAN